MAYTYEQESNLMKDGDYEVTIEKIERKVMTSGKEKLAITYRVRTDVEQPYGNKCVFEDIWEEKLVAGVFNRKRINQLLGTQEIKDGTVFEDIKEIIDFMTGKNLIIHLVTEFDEYWGEEKNRVSFYKSSKNKPQRLGGTPSPAPQPQVVTPTPEVGQFEIDDDDLPF